MRVPGIPAKMTLRRGRRAPGAELPSKSLFVRIPFRLLSWAVPVLFVILITIVMLFYSSQDGLHRAQIGVQDVFLSWNALQSDAKSMSLSKEKLSSTYSRYATRLRNLEDQLAVSESMTKSLPTLGDELSLRLNYFYSGMNYGIAQHTELSGWLDELSRLRNFDDFRLGKAEANAGEPLKEMDYPALLESWIGERISELDMLFAAPFADMEAALNGIIHENIESMQHTSEKLELALSAALLVLLLVFVLRMQRTNRVLDVQTASLEELNSTLEAKVTSRTEHLERTLKELKLAQNQLIRSEKFAQLGQLVAGVAHEVNTPLGIGITGITFQIQKLRELKKQLEESQQGGAKALSFKKLMEDLSSIGEAADIVFSNLDRASEIVSSFKALSVDQTGDRKRLFKPREVIHQTLISLIPRARQDSYAVELECDAELEVFGFPGSFSQIFTNLVQNSIFHGFADIESGKISIHASIVDIEGVRTLEIDYTDDGCGISEDILPQIFEPFFSTRHDSGGSGLGLSVVRNLVEGRFNGAIQCESPPSTGAEKGTRFVIRIPVPA